MPTTTNKRLITDATGKRIARAIELSNGGTAVLSTKSIVSNGTYTAANDNADGYSEITVSVPNSYSIEDNGKVVSNGVLVNQIAHATVTENGTIDTTLNNSVTINVAGSGGSQTLYGTAAPTSNLGNDGDYYVKCIDFNVETDVERIYNLTITGGLRGNDTLSYVGSCYLDFIMDDGQGGEVSLPYKIGLRYYCQEGGYVQYAFDRNLTTYWEASPTPVHLSMTATVPGGYTPKKLISYQRTGTYNQDVWSGFTLTETIDGHTRTLANVSGLTQSDWAGEGNATEFDIRPGSRYSVDVAYVKINGEWSLTDKIEVTLSIASNN